MSPRPRFYGALLAVAFLTSTGAAVAQELQLDPKALDTSGASVQVKRKGKKGARKHKGKRGAHLPKMPMGHCAKCGRTIFGGPKGMNTHMRKKHRSRR